MTELCDGKYFFEVAEVADCERRFGGGGDPLSKLYKEKLEYGMPKSELLKILCDAVLAAPDAEFDGAGKPKRPVVRVLQGVRPRGQERQAGGSRPGMLEHGLGCMVRARGPRFGDLSVLASQSPRERLPLTSPRVLLLDEPSEGIQPSIVDQIANTLRGINERRGVTVVLVEQNLDFASQLATRAYLVDKGRAVRELPTNDILNDKDLQREHLGI